MDRRQFIRRAAAGTMASVGIPYFVPSSALGAAGHVAPSNRTTLGFIGMGKMMRGHLGGFLNRSRCHVVAICDVESIRLGQQQRRVDDFYGNRYGKGSYKGCAAYKNFLALCDRDDLDAVVIATPDHWHALTALAALKSGKDVYCEKPLTLTINEGRYLVTATRRYGRVFQTGSQQRSSWQFRRACEIVRNGRIGKVHTVHVNVGDPSVECYLPAQPVPEGLDWDFWLGPAPYRPYNEDIAPPVTFGGWPNFRSYRDYSGGGMTDWGAHHFDIAQWGLGMDDSGPVEVIPPDGKKVERLTYKYANGVTMYHGGATGRAGVEFKGPKGRVLVNRGYIETDPPSLLDEPIRPNDLRLYHSDNHQDNWLDCLHTRSKPICDVEIGHRSATVCHLGNIAYWIKRPLKWDPVKERFVDDDEANRMLQRPMRSPWRLS
ncbi:MAG: Gfo/Idh/MocA family oxidoreductase [Phycisphaerae bacterium]|nr:Gfo/Idh/MocA family oxidoreductase [Phycisphaerae bacterium]